MYTKQTLEHFQHPRNMGEIKDPDGIGEVGNLRCGDVMKVYIKVATRPKTNNEKLITNSYGAGSIDREKQEEYIEDIKFQTLGCAAAIAASSMMTELAKGKSLEEAEKITRDDINGSLGQLPPQKYHCSVLSAEGIKRAIEDYKKKTMARQSQDNG